MAHFAEIDENNIVLRVVVVDNGHETGGAEYLKYDLNLGGTWIKTSYNGNIRKNFAGIGYYFNPMLDAFIPPQPFPSWVLDESACQWVAPSPLPLDGVRYVWDENVISWVVSEEKT